MKETIINEFEKFLTENPYADSMELATHFFEFGIQYEKKNHKTLKEIEEELPPFYGN